MSESVFALLTLVLLGTFLWGLFLAVFRSGKRKKGVRIFLGSFVAVIVVAGLFGTNAANEDAIEAGFIDAADMRAAEAEGITDPDAWEVRKEEIRIEEAARAAEAAAEAQREAERREAERAAEEAAREAERAAEEAARRAEEREERRKGFHCLSAWDGSHQAFKRAVRDAMRNPDSFEHVETRITPVNDAGTHTVLMTYRAENGFGGMNVGEALAEVSNETCQATILTIE